jgi:AraC family transcriptional regulator of adaptative response/methylated-DNA-[protein]-cysteine methyltransferase
VCLFEFADRRGLETQIQTVRETFRQPAVPGTNTHLDELMTQVRRYFEGRLQRFTVPLDTRGSDFQEAVWSQLLEIPHGQTRSYDQIARAVGRPGAQRAVGRANGQNRVAVVIPCHRVVRSDGQLGGYGGGLWRKQYLLDLERSVVASEVVSNGPSGTLPRPAGAVRTRTAVDARPSRIMADGSPA